MARAAASGLDSHGSFQARGEVISDRINVYILFLTFFTWFLQSVLYYKVEQMETSFTLFLDRMYDPSVCPFSDGCSRDDVQAVRHIVSLVCLISHIKKCCPL